MPRAACDRVLQHPPPLFERLQPFLQCERFCVSFIGEVVGDSGERIDRVEVSSKPFWDERRTHREIFIMRARQPLAVLVSSIERPDLVAREWFQDDLSESARLGNSAHLRFEMFIFALGCEEKQALGVSSSSSGLSLRLLEAAEKLCLPPPTSRWWSGDCLAIGLSTTSRPPPPLCRWR